MAARRRVERRNADQAVHAFFRFQIPVSVFAFNRKGCALNARFVAGLHIHDVDAIAVAFGPAHVHADEHLRPVLGFGAAGAGMEGDDGVARIVFIGKKQEDFPLFYVFHQFLILLFNFAGQIGIAFFHGQLQVIAGILHPLHQLFMAFDFGFQLRRFLRNGLGLFRVVPKVRIAHLHIQIHNSFFFSR